MLGVAQEAGVRDHDGANGAQARDDLLRLGEPSHMGIAGGEIAIRHGEAGILLDREEWMRRCLIEAASQEMRLTDDGERGADPGAWAEAQRGLDMRDRNVRLARLHSEDAADVPGAREIRVEREGTVDQCHHGADVLAKIGQRLGGIRQDARVVARYFKSPSGEINTLQMVRRRIIAAAVEEQPETAIRGQASAGP